jgi:hypothetical protein
MISARILFFFLLLFTLIQCSPSKSELPFNIPIETDSAFHQYWYGGKAEITTYRLSQNQYGERYDGVLTTIFVTEDFDLHKSVKSDSPADTNDHVVPILKMIMEKRFLTGIYPYTQMLSVFSPLVGDQSGRAVKISASSLEWCGQTFAQWQGNPKNWQLESFSYFERQGDQQLTFDRIWHEDELWSIIRLAPEHLPKDTFSLLSGNFNLRDRVARAEQSTAVGSLDTGSEGTQVYRLDFPESGRILSIEFEGNFPNRIISFSDTFYRHEQKVVHRAEKYKTMKIDYWKYNSNRDRHLYDELMPTNAVSANEIINN